MDDQLKKLIADRNKKSFLDRQRLQAKRERRVLIDKEIVFALTNAAKALIAAQPGSIKNATRELQYAITNAERRFASDERPQVGNEKIRTEI